MAHDVCSLCNGAIDRQDAVAVSYEASGEVRSIAHVRCWMKEDGMSILYICDRCSTKTTDYAEMRSVSLCYDHPAGGERSTRPRVGNVDSIRMLCARCIATVQATITEQLPLEKAP